MKPENQINRRDFVKLIAQAVPSFAILPSAVTYLRNWKFFRQWIPNEAGVVVPSCKEFTDFLIRQMPRYDSLILKDIVISEDWIGRIQWRGFKSDIYQ